jgi:uncharacterized protein YdhG (YjbR/CyaY superfamily)
MPTKQSAKTGSNAQKPAKLWSDVERAAAQETARERKRQSRRRPEDERAEGELEVRAKIAEMPPAERSMAERVHALVAAAAPSLVPRTYYGMPAYARDGKVICFFQAASKFKVRYSTFGFQPDARLDDGAMWPIAYALTKLSAADEARIAALVKQAVG